MGKYPIPEKNLICFSDIIIQQCVHLKVGSPLSNDNFTVYV